MTTFIETPRFPEQIGYNFIGGAGYNTTVIVVNSGFEQRNVNWSESRCKYDIQNGLLKYSDVQALVSFFRSVKGKGFGFRFKDWQDFTAIAANGALGTGVADGTSTAYQMNKLYITGSLNESRIISKPVSTTIIVYKNGIPLIEGTNYTINYATGIVTFMSTPSFGDLLNWAGQFDVPVRFDTDDLTGQYDGSGLWLVQKLPIIEIRI